MQKTQRTFTKEFKVEAVQLVQSSKKPLAHIARDLGIADSTLHHWCQLFSHQGEQAFPGSGHQTPQEEEIRHLKRENDLLRQERDIYKKSYRHLFARPSMKYQFIAEHKHEYAITVLCQALEVSESGYYGWKNR